MRTRLEIRTRVATDTRETQINSTIEEYINQTLMEIENPAWAFEAIGIRGYEHNWSFNRRKYTLTTVASTEFYQLPRDLDKISIVRQTTAPAKLSYIPDEVFYKFIPYPTATGTPLYYRLWEEEGVSVRLSTDDMISIKSSTADTATVRIVGMDTNGLMRTESLTLNGVTKVDGTITYDAGKPLRVSKSADTTGVITIEEKTSGTDLVLLAPTERSARFKVIGLYPIPSSAISIYIEYFTRIRRLEGDNDVPDIDEKWLWVVRLGAMAKVYQYQKEENLFPTTQALYATGVRSMCKADMMTTDYIPSLASHRKTREGVVTLDDLGYGDYGLTF